MVGKARDTAERRLLGRMRLHAVTSVHGEAGPRERLLMEIAQFPAAAVAGLRRHWCWPRGCTRETGQREPYVNHLLRVTLRIGLFRTTGPKLYRLAGKTTSRSATSASGFCCSE
jgi:hypothetical protein